jgi:hypothetical protein
MKNDQIPFERVRKILLDLGFVETRIPGPYGPYSYFKHAPSETILVYRDYQPGESITWGDHVKTQKFLDLNGLLEADDFEDRLHQTPV